MVERAVMPDQTDPDTNKILEGEAGSPNLESSVSSTGSDIGSW